MPFIRKILLSLPAVIWAIVTFAAGVGPEDARSNLASWAAHFGLHQWPIWLTDRRVVFGLFLAVFAFYFWLWRHYRPAKRLATESEPRFDFDNSDVEMEDTITEGDQRLVRSRGGKFRSKRWWHIGSKP